MEPILVPPGQPGPNYIAEGFFPDCGLDDYLSVIVQLDTGSRHVATFHKGDFSFTSPIVPTTFVTVVCWFYFPNEEPNTEHEWFVSKFKVVHDHQDRDTGFWEKVESHPYGYEIDSDDCISLYGESLDIDMQELCDNDPQADAMELYRGACYHHWVANGRKKPTPDLLPANDLLWFRECYRDLGYLLGASPGGSPCCFSGHNPSCWTSKRVETKQDAIDQAYLHWVAAGRPKPSTV